MSGWSYNSYGNAQEAARMRQYNLEQARINEQIEEQNRRHADSLRQRLYDDAYGPNSYQPLSGYINSYPSSSVSYSTSSYSTPSFSSPRAEETAAEKEREWSFDDSTNYLRKAGLLHNPPSLWDCDEWIKYFCTGRVPGYSGPASSIPASSILDDVESIMRGMTSWEVSSYLIAEVKKKLSINRRFWKRVKLDLDRLLGEMALDKVVRDTLFDTHKWRCYLGHFNYVSFVTKGMISLMKAPCPIWPGKRVCETHTITFLPPTVNGVPFKFMKLLGIAKKTMAKGRGMTIGFPNTKTMDRVLEEYGCLTPIKPVWVLVTKEVVPGTEHRTLEEQKKIIQCYPKYHIPTMLEVATSAVVRGLALKRSRRWPSFYTSCGDRPFGNVSRVEAKLDIGSTKLKVFYAHSTLTRAGALAARYINLQC